MVKRLKKLGREDRMNKQRIEDFQGSKVIYFNTEMEDIYHYTFLQTLRM